MKSRWPWQASPNSLRNSTNKNIHSSENKTYPSEKTSTWPKCLMCKTSLTREIKVTGIHDASCPWNYYIECKNCRYQNNLSKLLGFWHGCSNKCREQHGFEIDGRFSETLPNETKLTHTYLPTYLPNPAPNETGGRREGSL